MSFKEFPNLQTISFKIRTMKPISCLLIFLFFSLPFSHAQHNIVEDDEGEKHESNEHGHEAFKKHHTISAMMAFSYIPSIIPGESDREILVVPTWAINYTFSFHPKWAVGLHNDLILQQYAVERHTDSEEVVRSYPFAVKAVVLFEPMHGLLFLTGYGKEFESSKTLDVITVGVEYAIPIRNGWETGFNLIFDWNVNNYVSWMFGILCAEPL